MYTCECYTLCKCIAVNPLRTSKNMLYVHCVCKPVNIIHYVMCSCEPLRTSKNIKSPSGLLAHLTFVYITHPSVCTRLQDDTVWSTTSLCVYLIGVIPLHVWQFYGTVLQTSHLCVYYPPIRMQNAHCWNSQSATPCLSYHCKKLESRGKLWKQEERLLFKTWLLVFNDTTEVLHSWNLINTRLISMRRVTIMRIPTKIN